MPTYQFYRIKLSKFESGGFSVVYISPILTDTEAGRAMTSIGTCMDGHTGYAAIRQESYFYEYIIPSSILCQLTVQRVESDPPTQLKTPLNTTEGFNPIGLVSPI